MRLMVLTAAAAALFVYARPSLAQGERPHVTVMASADGIRDAIARQLAVQKFSVREAKSKLIVFEQDRGSVATTTGDQLKVRLEVEFVLKPRGDSTEVLLSRETLVGAARDGADRRREIDPKQNRASFQALLDLVKAELNGPGASASP